MHTNPFLQKYTTPFDVPPFDAIQFSDYEEAMLEGMKREVAEYEQIVSNPEAPTFENTIDTDGDKTLSRATSVFFNLLSAHTNDEMDALAQKMQPLLTEHAQNFVLDPRNFERIKLLKERYENPATAPRQLDAEEQTLLEHIYEGFERSGATLPDDKKQRYRELSQELGMVTLQFQQNELKDTNNFSLYITDPSQLKGLPPSAIDAAALAAKQADKPLLTTDDGIETHGWLFTLHAPSYGPFMTYSEVRDLREQMYRASSSVCLGNNEYNNVDLVRRIVDLRREIAQLFGYPNWASYVLKHRMAEDVAHVNKLLQQLLAAYMPKAREEVAEIEAFARAKEGEDFKLMPWDFSHYSHLLKMERYNIDSEMLRPYLELSKVKQGVYGLATRLYGITFHLRADIPTYHPDVEAWEVRDADGTFLAILYTDFHPRPSKQSGAWMTTFQDQYRRQRNERWEDTRPIVSLVMNFTKPTETKPALLTLGEVETFLHEFGHALHAIFSKVRFESLSCTNVYRDFVELPSQFMENYAVEPEFLHTFARHYETDEPMPDELIERIRRCRNYCVAYSCIRQVSFGMLDMAYYTLEKPFAEAAAQLEGPATSSDVERFERQAWAPTQLLPTIEGACMSVRFGHIMNGGYSAGYYSYKWAEVLDADAFSVFQQEGIFNQQTARRFRDEVLSRGGTEPPMNLYRRFRGGEPSIDALLRRNGIALSDAHEQPVQEVSVPEPAVSEHAVPSEFEPHRNKKELDRRYLRMAHIWSENSYCKRRQVGALIVKDKMIISDGYNGTPTGFENICEDELNVSKPYVLHAEANAITKIARSNNNSDGATLYVTDSPCIECAKLIIQAGIRRVVFARSYRLTEGIDLLRRAGIEIIQMEI